MLHQVWEEDSAHCRFWKRLLNDRVDLLVNSKDWLKGLRYRHDEVKWWNKRCKHIFEERGVNLYQLIAQANGECWDDEDEQKCAHAVEENVDPPMLKEKPRQDAVSLDHPCQVRVRSGQKEELELHVRSSHEGRKIELQAGREGLYRRAGCTQEAPPKKKKQKSEEVGGGRGVNTQHTKGLGNIEEGRLAEKAPKKKRQRKRPALGSQFKKIN